MIYTMKRTTKRVFFSFFSLFLLSFFFVFLSEIFQTGECRWIPTFPFSFSLVVSHPRSRHKALCPLSPTLQENWLGPAFVLIKPPSHRRNCQGERPSTHRINSREERKKKKGNPCRFVLFGPHNGERDWTHTHDIYQQITSSSSYSHWSILPEIRTRLISTVSDGKEQQRRALEKKKRAPSSKGTEQANRIGEGK